VLAFSFWVASTIPAVGEPACVRMFGQILEANRRFQMQRTSRRFSLLGIYSLVFISSALVVCSHFDLYFLRKRVSVTPSESSRRSEVSFAVTVSTFGCVTTIELSIRVYNSLTVTASR